MIKKKKKKKPPLILRDNFGDSIGNALKSLPILFAIIYYNNIICTYKQKNI